MYASGTNVYSSLNLPPDAMESSIICCQYSRHALAIHVISHLDKSPPLRLCKAQACVNPILGPPFPYLDLMRNVDMLAWLRARRVQVIESGDSHPPFWPSHAGFPWTSEVRTVALAMKPPHSS